MQRAGFLAVSTKSQGAPEFVFAEAGSWVAGRQSTREISMRNHKEGLAAVDSSEGKNRVVRFWNGSSNPHSEVAAEQPGQLFNPSYSIKRSICSSVMFAIGAGS